MSVSVSIVTHGSEGWIETCLESVRAQGRVVQEVLLADNASRDATLARVRRRFPEVSVLALPANTGFAVAHNRNFARSRGHAFLALNPDVALGPGCLARLLEALWAEPDRGAVAPRLLRPGPRARLDSTGIARSPTRFVDRGAGQAPERFAEEGDVFGACGAVALYRREALEAVSRAGEAPFAERFFMYYEDVDLAWRLRRAGWRTRYLPAAEARHARGGSGAGAAFVEYHLVRNRLWVSLRNASAGELLRELPGLALFEGAKLLQSLWRPHLRRALGDSLAGIPRCLSERSASRPAPGRRACG